MVWLFITRRKQQKSFCYDHCDVNLCAPYKATHCVYFVQGGMLSCYSFDYLSK